MDGLVVVFLIISAVVAMLKNASKFNKTRPGGGTPPGGERPRSEWNPTAPDRTHLPGSTQAPGQPYAQAPVQPAPTQSAGQMVSSMKTMLPNEMAFGGELETGEAVSYGNLGTVRAKSNYSESAPPAQLEGGREVSAARLTPEDMRRAVIMAEILTRPAERNRRRTLAK